MTKKKSVKKNNVLSIVGFVIMVIVIILEIAISFQLNELEIGAIIIIIIFEIIELCEKEAKKTLPIITIILAVLCFAASCLLTPTESHPVAPVDGWTNISANINQKGE